jgi:methylated-DNA-[protein]-cysteine S-methyltransferase
MDIELQRLDTPIGWLVLAADAAGLRALDFARDDGRVRARLAREGVCFRDGGKAVAAAARKVRDYFEGDLAALDAIPVAIAEGTDFQRKVWRSLRKIPVGSTRSYGALARAIGRPNAVRAVGAANGANPIALVLPCHRVIASDGTLCGYGGGLPRKEWLLKHEGALLA